MFKQKTEPWLLSYKNSHTNLIIPDKSNNVITQLKLSCFRILNELRTCYENVFTESCGQVGGRVIGGLMTTAFQDPFYLRYKYKPDCELHRTTEATPQATQPRATRKPHHRPKTERSKVSDKKDNVKSKPTSPNKDELRSHASSSTCSGILLALTLSVVLLHKR